jgi:hypothetical protein
MTLNAAHQRWTIALANSKENVMTAAINGKNEAATTIRELDDTELTTVSGGSCRNDKVTYQNQDNPAVAAFIIAFQNNCGGYCY